MAQQNCRKFCVTNQPNTAAVFACAVASFILINRTLSLALGVLLMVWVLRGILISLALLRRFPQPERI